jgi:hypothetical protein
MHDTVLDFVASLPLGLRDIDGRPQKHLAFSQSPAARRFLGAREFAVPAGIMTASTTFGALVCPGVPSRRQSNPHPSALTTNLAAHITRLRATPQPSAAPCPWAVLARAQPVDTLLQGPERRCTDPMRVVTWAGSRSLSRMRRCVRSVLQLRTRVNCRPFPPRSAASRLRTSSSKPPSSPSEHQQCCADLATMFQKKSIAHLVLLVKARLGTPAPC